MSLLFSRECEYALQAVIRLASSRSAALVSIHDLSRELGIPAPFLSKVLRKLASRGLLRSSRGPNGGFGLRGDPSAMTLMQIINAIDGANPLDECVLGKRDCTKGRQCAIHDDWIQLRDKLSIVLTCRPLNQLSP